MGDDFLGIENKKDLGRKYIPKNKSKKGEKNEGKGDEKKAYFTINNSQN